METCTERTVDATQSLCPRCESLVPAEILIRGGAAYLRKACPTHGQMEVLLDASAARYLAGRRPGGRPAADAPLDLRQDLRTTPDQAVCVVVIDVTDACNLRCPTCFAAAEGHRFLSMAGFERALGAALARKPDLDLLQISGGEPTIHPQILEIVARAQAAGVRVVQINTNGIRIARDDDFLAALGRLQPAVYLSFDTFRPHIYQELRGARLLDLKLRAVERLASLGIAITLACTVQRGLNEDELADIVRFGMSHPSVRAVVFQPTFYAGRAPDHDPGERVTSSEVLERLEQQVGGVLKANDFVPVPCCNPACTQVTFVFREGDVTVPLTRLVDPADYEEFLRGRLVDATLSDLVNQPSTGPAQADAPC
ncbi:MAG: radical SAM protein [Armatimonadetes bacterium]|nr:radical SAM protein [Armatimonadota bacterium]